MTAMAARTPSSGPVRDTAPADKASAADILVEQLAKAGIDFLFANGGTDFPPIVEAFARAAKEGAAVPRPMVVTHENAAVAMAYGHYLVSGRPQAVMVHVNVGSANTINMLLDASRDNIPLLLMAGRSPYTEHGPHGTRTRYIHWGQEMFDQAGMLREAVKWDYELHLPEQAGDVIARALEVAMTAPRGPVYLTLPRDVLAAATSRRDAAAARRVTPSIAHPDPAAITRAAEWLAAADRPLIVTANAGRTAAGFHALSALAERFAVPVVSFHPRYLNLPSGHPMNGGYLPGPFLKEADLVLVVDCDVPWIPSLEAPPAGCRIVQIGEDPAFVRYPMRNFPSDLSITAETATALAALAAAAETQPALRADRVATRRAAMEETARMRRALARSSTPGEVTTPEWISRCIGEAVGEDAIIVNEYPLRLDHCPRERPGTYFGLSPAGGLGWGLGAALGAKLAAPERLVVATLGDGAYLFANPAACHWVSAAHQLPVLTVVFNNQLYGAVRNATRAMYATGEAMQAGGRMFADLRPAPDFERYVEASGGHGERVERAADLPAALARAIHAVTIEKRQALLNVLCDY